MVAAFENNLNSTFASMGSNTFNINQYKTQLRGNGGINKIEKINPIITYPEAKAFKEKYSYPLTQTSLSFIATSSAEVKFENQKTDPEISVLGIDEYFLANSGLEVTQGRNLCVANYLGDPVKYTHINSLFNMHRVHPVTHVSRPHNGVDLAGPLGAPVQSIGDGTVQFIGWDGDYGNLVTIQHNDKYSSKYAHLLRFAPGIHKGSHVTRGQLIGYLGQTGNATGPHVHFEVRIYNKPVNPLTAPLPYVETIPTAQKNAFRNKAKQLIIALDQYQKNNLK